MSPIRNPGIQSAFTFYNTVLSTGATPNNTYTDINLSTVSGTRKTILLLRYKNESGGVQTINFRANESISQTRGIQTALSVADTHVAHLLCYTDSSGIFEWTTDNGGNGTLTLIAYSN